MSKITLNPEALIVESFEPAPEASDVTAAWTALECGTYDGQLTVHVWVYSCGYDISCQRYNCDS